MKNVSKIINRIPAVGHCLYADDLYVLCKRNVNAKTATILEKVIQDISDRSEYSGRKISLKKTKKLNVCRKHNCDAV